MGDSTQLGLEVGVPLGVVGAITLSGLGVLIRYRLKEGKISQMIWKIDYHEIVFSHSSSSAMSSRSIQNIYQSTSFTVASDEYGVAGKPTAIYRGQSVHVHKVEHTHEIKLTRQELVELVNMKEVNHDNILTFVGACLDPGNLCYVTTYCSRGSVQSLVDDDEIKLDWVFKMSMISDIASGMQYLHKSPFQSHGHLTANNCYVDNRWVVKIGGFGLRSFRNEMEVPKMGEVVYYRKMLWTSPELLRTAYTRPPNGTQKGDVYSFSIIVQQIIYRAQPYFGENVEPKVIIERVMSRPTDQPCYRPTPPSSFNDDEINPQLVTMMKQCWAEDPTDRPTFADLLLTLRRINNGRKIDIVSSMLQKLEKYAENLEQTVKQRTMELEDEKRKTDLLLYRMLPAFVADELKAGRTVAPQVYESATVYFSDIVGYTRLSSESTPLEVVDLLNDLYNLFDDVILRYDVYKVETIGDAYMVVSGLPKTNDGQHICEISNMALSLLDEVYRFKIRHRPNERIKLRIGIHTGLCAAALKIHLSQWAYEALMKYPGYVVEPRGETFVKGKGMLPTYWLLGRQDAMLKFLVPTAAGTPSTTGNATSLGPNKNA